MKNIRLTPLITVSIGLLLASLGVLGNWAYNRFIKSNDEQTGELIILKPVDSLVILNPVNSSLPSSYTSQVIGNKKNRDAKKTPVNDKTTTVSKTLPDQFTSNEIPANETAMEINKLKTEIETLSKKKTNDADLRLAKQKIEELEKKVDKLVNKNSDVESENKRLFTVLKKLSDEMKEYEQKATPWQAVYENKAPEIKTSFDQITAYKTTVNKNNNRLSASTTGSAEKIRPLIVASSASANSFAIEDIKLTALTVTDNNKEIETFQAYQTDKFSGYVILKNTGFQNNDGEIYLVVLQPDGRVLQKSGWESGTFQSREGKKVYSCRMRFDYKKGESTRLSFSLNAANSLKGNYILQVYSRGVLIGKIIKVLS